MNKRRPNLCLFTNRFGHGGTEHQFADLVSRLDQSKYDILVGCFSMEGEFFEKMEAARLPVIEFSRGRWFSPDTVRCALAWMRLLRRQGIEMVHTFDYFTTVFAGSLARLAGIPLLVTSRRDTGSMYTPRQRWVIRRVFFQSDRVVANSEAARDSLLDEGISSEAVRIVRNGVDLQQFQSNGNGQSARRRWGWSADGPLIGLIANLRPEKGHMILLKAIPAVIQRFPRAHFLLAGPGPLEGELRRYVADNNLTSYVSFLGDFYGIPDLLAALDIVVLPSTSESMPNVVLETMSAGRPIIASAVGGCKELIDHGRTGLLFPPGDSPALAEQILMLLDTPDVRARLGYAARRHAESEFDINVAVKRLEAVYDELLDRKAGALS
jgi:glycosyltransferase involved in cell wall biosynthesis